MYQDLYLSFPDEASAKAVLYRIDGAVETNEELGIEASPGHEVANFANSDTIGVIYKATGETTEQDGMAVPVMVAIPGWHVNVRVMPGEDAATLTPFAVEPKTPTRIWG